MFKLGQSGCESQHCSAVVRRGTGRAGQESHGELGSEAQSEGSVACFLQIGKEMSVERHPDLHLVLPQRSALFRSCHVSQKYLRHC